MDFARLAHISQWMTVPPIGPYLNYRSHSAYKSQARRLHEYSGLGEAMVDWGEPGLPTRDSHN